MHGELEEILTGSPRAPVADSSAGAGPTGLPQRAVEEGLVRPEGCCLVLPGHAGGSLKLPASTETCLSLES